MTDAPQVTPPRLRYLDGLRAAAALFVLVHHTMMMAFPIWLGEHPTGALGYAIGWLTYGHFGVTIFIVLAGYSLFLAVARKEGELPGGFWGYMGRRAWRILPPYWIVLAATILLVKTVISEPTGTHWDLSVPTSPIMWITDGALLQDVLTTGRDTAYTFWSVGVEWHVYLVLPLILFIRRRSTWPAAIAVAGVLGAFGTVAAFGAADLRRFHFEYYLLFALAAGACVVVRLAPAWSAHAPWRLAGGLLALVLVSLTVTHDYTWAGVWFPLLDLLVGASALCFLVSLGLGGSPRLAVALSWRPLVAAGAFSYTLYLVHAQLLQVFWQYAIQPFGLSRPRQLLIGWLVVVPVVVLLAWAVSLVVERPFVLLGERRKVAGDPAGRPAGTDAEAPPLDRGDDAAVRRWTSTRAVRAGSRLRGARRTPVPPVAPAGVLGPIDTQPVALQPRVVACARDESAVLEGAG